MHGDAFATAPKLCSYRHASRASSRRCDAPHPVGDRSGDQPRPSRSAAMKPARARRPRGSDRQSRCRASSCGRLPLKRAARGQIRFARRPAFVRRRNFWAARPETRFVRNSGPRRLLCLADREAPRSLTSPSSRTSWGTRPSCRSVSPRNACRSPARERRTPPPPTPRGVRFLDADAV
jgi:hypothetical protein